VHAKKEGKEKESRDRERREVKRRKGRSSTDPRTSLFFFLAPAPSPFSLFPRGVRSAAKSKELKAKLSIDFCRSLQRSLAFLFKKVMVKKKENSHFFVTEFHVPEKKTMQNS